MSKNIDGVVELHSCISPEEERILNGQLRSYASKLIKESDARARQAAKKIYKGREDYAPPIGWR